MLTDMSDQYTVSSKYSSGISGNVSKTEYIRLELFEWERDEQNVWHNQRRIH